MAEADLVARVVSTEEPEPDLSGGLSSARVVVGAGRGAGGADGFDDLLELTELLGASLGVSRVVTSLGWRPHHEQVGQTGSRIAPDLYIPCGISGAIQHWAGCASAKNILAINTDAEAPMVTKATYAVIGDLHEGDMEWWLVDLMAVRRSRRRGRLLMSRRRAHRADAEELAGVRMLADEDVTQLGGQLSRFDSAVDRLDEAGRHDYQRALDAYESAQRAVPRMRGVGEINTVGDRLRRRVRPGVRDARLRGLPIPPYRVRAFFNPQHGPSTEDVLTGARARHPHRPGVRPGRRPGAAGREAGGAPVTVGARRVPYWEAGAGYLPYTQGYFVGADAVGGASLAWAYDPSMIASGGSGYVHGEHGGFDGGFDGGGASATAVVVAGTEPQGSGDDGRGLVAALLTERSGGATGPATSAFKRSVLSPTWRSSK